MSKIEILRKQFLNQEINGHLIDEDIFNKALNKCIGDKRISQKVFKYVKDEEVVEQHVEAEHVEKAINSAFNLRNRQNSNNVKFDDVRNMDLSLSNWDTYQPAEQKFAQERLCAYQEFYSLDAPNDILGIYDVIDLEVRMQTIRLYIRLTKKKDDIIDYDKQLKELRLQWSKTLEDLNLKKKQRDSKKEIPKDTSNDLSNAIKSLDEMQAEIAKKKQEIQKKKEEKRRSNK